MFATALPGAWLREDIVNVLNALDRGRSDEYHQALLDVATALGLRYIEPPPVRHHIWMDAVIVSR
jgi:hypothetical protein